MYPILSEYSSASTDIVSAALLEGLSHVSGELIIILDDYHVLESSSIHDVLAELIQYLPDHIHLFIATRAKLPIPTIKMQAKGQIHLMILIGESPIASLLQYRYSKEFL